MPTKRTSQLQKKSNISSESEAMAATKINDNGDKTMRDLVPLSIGVDTKGELLNVVIPRNTPVPTKMSRNYTTTRDNQPSMCICVYQGERTKSTNNYLLGKINFNEVPLAPRGVQKVKVCIEIDANQILTVTATLLSTGMIEKMTNINGRLSREKTDNMIEDAKMYEFKDQEHKREVEAYNAFDDYVYLMENRVKDTNIKEKLSVKDLKTVVDAIAAATKWLNENKGASVDKIEFKKKELKKACRVMETSKRAKNQRRHLMDYYLRSVNMLKKLFG